ncbi:MAG: alpha/beta hydrolase [Oscillospiraceae bacterium]|nr:alpha/beta hydrolase [Oscillospiraceae bacterium]
MIYYEKYGEDSPGVIMFLHDMNFVHCFTKQCAYFARKCEVIVPHIPGFGRNCEVTFSVDLAVEQISELARSLKKPITLIGFSLGAELCIPLICKHGDLFNGVIMISPWLIKEMDEIEAVMKQQADNEKSMRKGDLGGSVGLSKMEKQEHKEFCKNVTMKSILASIDNGLQIADYPEFSEVTKPMMAICGLKESLSVRKSTRELARLNQGCTYDMWDGAVHNIPYKFASRLNKTIEDFILQLQL